MGSDHTKLVELISRCDPGAPADETTYVERARPLVPRVIDELRPASRPRILLMGQTGVGKSTELGALARSVRRDFVVIRPPVDTHLDLQFVSWHDLFVFAALHAAETIKPALKRDLESALEPAQTIEIDDSPFRAAGKRTVTRGGVPSPSGIQRFRNNHQAVSRTIEAGPAQFWDLATKVLQNVESAEGKELVIIFDGLEKMAEPAARKLYYEQGRNIEELPFRAVVTAPLAMSFEKYFGDVEEHFRFTERLRALSVQPGEAGREFLLEVAGKRGAAEVVPGELIDELITWSGGLPRQFLNLLATGASQALSDGLNRVAPESVVRARIVQAGRWEYQLEPNDFRALAMPDRNRSAADRSRLLRLGALVEYEKPDGSLLIGLNPLVEPLLSASTNDARP